MSMKSEGEIIHEIERIGQESQNITDAVKIAQSLLAAEIGGSTLLIDFPKQGGISPRAAKSISDFLDSREYPFRGIYTAPLVAGDERSGRLIACFGSFESPGEFLQRLTAHIAQQFGPLLTRTPGKAIRRPEAA